MNMKYESQDVVVDVSENKELTSCDVTDRDKSANHSASGLTAVEPIVNRQREKMAVEHILSDKDLIDMGTSRSGGLVEHTVTKAFGTVDVDGEAANNSSGDKYTADDNAAKKVDVTDKFAENKITEVKVMAGMESTDMINERVKVTEIENIACIDKADKVSEISIVTDAVQKFTEDKVTEVKVTKDKVMETQNMTDMDTEDKDMEDMGTKVADVKDTASEIEDVADLITADTTSSHQDIGMKLILLILIEFDLSLFLNDLFDIGQCVRFNS